MPTTKTTPDDPDANDDIDLAPDDDWEGDDPVDDEPTPEDLDAVDIDEDEAIIFTKNDEFVAIEPYDPDADHPERPEDQLDDQFEVGADRPGETRRDARHHKAKATTDKDTDDGE